MTLQELQELAYRASGGGLIIRALRDAKNGCIAVVVSRRDDRNGEMINARRNLMPLELETKPNVEQFCRELFCELAGATAAHEVGLRMGIGVEPAEPPRIVPVHS